MYVYISKQFRTKLNVTFGEIPKGIVEDFFVFFLFVNVQEFSSSIQTRGLVGKSSCDSVGGFSFGLQLRVLTRVSVTAGN